VEFGPRTLGEDAELNMVGSRFWSKQRVLLTGHTGFKGAWLSLWLSRMGARVSGLSLAPDTEPSLFRLLGENHLARSAILDIRDRYAVEQVVEEVDPTIVIHMAAQALVRRGYRLPIETLETNVMGTAYLLNALRDRPTLNTVLVVTTDKVYRNLEYGRAFREDDPLGGHDPYSASKAAAEIAVSSWSGSFFHNAAACVMTARAGNVIGGGDWSEDRLVPDIWRAVHAGQKPVLRHPEATRPWQHVIEPLAGYLRYVECAASAEVPPSLNFGPYPDDVLNVRNVAEAMLDAMQAPQGWRHDGGPQFAEMQTLSLDPALAVETLGWRPRLTSREAIAWAAEWYGRFGRGEDPVALCLEQISRYENRP
jgi:CDP-glucose 4,6-dehydratase